MVRQINNSSNFLCNREWVPIQIHFRKHISCKDVSTKNVVLILNSCDSKSKVDLTVLPIEGKVKVFSHGMIIHGGDK